MVTDVLSRAACWPTDGVPRWRYETAAGLERSPIRRLREFPRDPEMITYATRFLAAVLIRSWLRVFHRFRVEGREHLPAERSFVLAANHNSHLDALCLLSALRIDRIHRAHPAAAEDYFFRDLGRLALAAIVINAMPFERELDCRRSLRRCRELLDRPGNILVIFPEGTRSATGRMGRFKRGIGLLLAGTDVPVVPCHLAGTYEAWPRSRMLPRPHGVSLAIGTPRTYAAEGSRKADALRVCAQLRQAIEDLAPDAVNREPLAELHYG